MTISEEELEARRRTLYNTLSQIRRYITMLGVPEDQRDDILQDVYVSAYYNIAKLEDIRKIYAWLRSIAYHEVIKNGQKWSRIRDYEIILSDEEWERTDMAGLEPIMCIEGNGELEDSELYEMVARLKAPAPQIIRLRFIEGFSLKEISDKLGIKYNTVKSIETRAFKQLKEEIEKGNLLCRRENKDEHKGKL